MTDARGSRLITGHETRLGRNSADEIKNHPFFAGVDWATIRNIESPFIPHLRYVISLSADLSSLTGRCSRSLTDTSYFPTEDLNDVPEQPAGGEVGSGSKDLAFLGYTVRPSSVCSSPAPTDVPGLQFRRYEGNPTGF